MRRPLSKRKCQHCIRPSLSLTRAALGATLLCDARMPQGQQSSQSTPLAATTAQPSYFRGPVHVERVEQWRQAHPGVLAGARPLACPMRYKNP